MTNNGPSLLILPQRAQNMGNIMFVSMTSKNRKMIETMISVSIRWPVVACQWECRLGKCARSSCKGLMVFIHMLTVQQSRVLQNRRDCRIILGECIVLWNRVTIFPVDKGEYFRNNLVYKTNSTKNNSPRLWLLSVISLLLRPLILSSPSLLLRPLLHDGSHSNCAFCSYHDNSYHHDCGSSRYSRSSYVLCSSQNSHSSYALCSYHSLSSSYARFISVLLLFLRPLLLSRRCLMCMCTLLNLQLLLRPSLVSHVGLLLCRQLLRPTCTGFSGGCRFFAVFF
jgi:hypothetical protein